jgi:hypothetical protein
MRVVFSVVTGIVVAFAVGATAESRAQEAGYRVQGIWDAAYQTPWGVASERLILLHNGTFTKSFKCKDKMAFFTGRYAVGEGFIRTVHDRGPIRTETTWFQFQGPNQMVFHDRMMGTTWTVHRVGP